ncbi:MAG: NAD-binding protein [Desulfurococcaceae archaeon]
MRKLSVLIVGGGRVCESLLLDDRVKGLVEDIVILERDPDRARSLQEIAPHAVIVEGDATDADVYSKIDMKSLSAVLALTDSDDANLFVLAIAKSYEVPLRIGRFTNARTAELVKKLQLGIPIVQPALVAGLLGQVLVSIFGVEPMGDIGAGNKLYAVTIGETDPAAGSRIEDLRLGDYSARAVLLFDGAKFKVPERDDVLAPGHILFVAAPSDDFVRAIKG